jgi:hypothetical protein
MLIRSPNPRRSAARVPSSRCNRDSGPGSDPQSEATLKRLDLRELEGDEAVEYAQHLQRVEQGRGQEWLLRCPLAKQERVEDAPRDPATREWVGTPRLRRFPW